MSRQRTNRDHLPALDGLRGTVALLVTGSHAGVFAWGISPGVYLGGFAVTIFFALSGFLMGYLHLGQGLNRGNLFHYVVNRAARIAPLYLTIIIVSYFVFRFIDPEFVYRIDNQNVARHLLFSGSAAVFWSIPPEVQFYAFFMLAWWGVARAAQKRLVPVVLVLLAVVGMAVVARYCPGTSLPTKIWLFTAGCFAGFLRQRKPATLALPPLCLPTLQVASFAITFWYAHHVFTAGPTAEGLYQSFPYACLAGFLVFLISQSTRTVNMILGNRAIRNIGKWSFALYLLHEPSFYLTDRLLGHAGLPGYAMNLMALALALALSCAAHHFVERPGQRIVRKTGGHLLARLTARFAADGPVKVARH